MHRNLLHSYPQFNFPRFFVAPTSSYRPEYPNLYHLRRYRRKATQFLPQLAPNNHVAALWAKLRLVAAAAAATSRQQKPTPKLPLQHQHPGYQEIIRSSRSFSSSNNSSSRYNPPQTQTGTGDSASSPCLILPPPPRLVGFDKEFVVEAEAEAEEEVEDPSLRLLDQAASSPFLFDTQSLADLCPTLPRSWKGYELPTPLWTHLLNAIVVSGRPMSFATYMHLCLTHPEHGYYTSNHRQDLEEEEDMGDSDENLQKYMIGRDFVTAPEISSVFGECIAVWFATQLFGEGKSSSNSSSDLIPHQPHFQWIECGPGKGTLMVDLLRASHHLGMLPFCRYIHFIETSPTLRVAQRRALEHFSAAASSSSWSLSSLDGQDAPYDLEKSNENMTSTSLSPVVRFEFVEDWRRSTPSAVPSIQHTRDDFSSSSSSSLILPQQQQQPQSSQARERDHHDDSATVTTISVLWHDSVTDLRRWQEQQAASVSSSVSSAAASIISTTSESPDPPPDHHHHRRRLKSFCICQEFVDTLPVYSFEKTHEGWRERLIDVAADSEYTNDDNSDDDGVHKVNSERFSNLTEGPETQSSSRNDHEVAKRGSSSNLKPRLRVVLAPEVTEPVRKLLKTCNRGWMPGESPDTHPDGTIVEVNPHASMLVQDLVEVMKMGSGAGGGGAALVIDYGSEGSRDTIRAYSKHRQVPFTSHPGRVDLTADVDFAALRNAVNLFDHNNSKSSFTSSHLAEGKSPETDSTGSRRNSFISAHAYGPVPQGVFLMSMGLKERVLAAIEHENTTDEHAENLYDAMVKLASTEEMGERFKVLAMVVAESSSTQDDNASQQIGRPPPGFEYATL